MQQKILHDIVNLCAFYCNDGDQTNIKGPTKGETIQRKSCTE